MQINSCIAAPVYQFYQLGIVCALPATCVSLQSTLNELQVATEILR